MKFLTDWAIWWDNSRKENKFHCDLLLEPGDSIYLVADKDKIEVISPPPGKYTKVHLSASWEHRNTLFVEED